MKHTPGPWKLTTVPTSIGICHKIGPFPVEGSPRENYACVYDDHRSTANPREELLANARLIAAAPELLEALKDMVRDGSQSYRDRVSTNAHAAIAKAEGR